MKRAILLGLMSAGFLAAQTDMPMSTETQMPLRTQSVQENQMPRLSWNERIALRTSSPPVKTGHKALRHGVQIEKNKSTIVAFVPVGK